MVCGTLGRVVCVTIGLTVVLGGRVLWGSEPGHVASSRGPDPLAGAQYTLAGPQYPLAGPQWLQMPSAPWQPRDSQAECVFQDRLWIMGGWLNSWSAPPRDVWSSADGKSWQQVTPETPWLHTDLAMCLAFGDRMWVMGGWHNGRLPGHSASHEVWSTTDGKSWQCMTRAAPWSARLAAAVVEFQGKIWLLGGTENYYFGDEHSIKNDVWSSTDGRNWEQVCAHAAWSPRAYHQAVVLNNRLYVMGGGNYVPHYQANHDVWSTTDGVHWECETMHAPWHARLWFSAATFRDRMWVVGGWSNDPPQNWHDVWYSPNGRDWQSLVPPPGWTARHEHSLFVHQDQLWVAGGHANPLSNEVWRLALPKDVTSAAP